MYRVIKILFRSMASVYMSLYVVSILFCFGTDLCGLDKYVVTSGSMLPQIPVGSCIWSKEILPQKLQTGDIITFRLSDTDTIVTHRIISVQTKEETVRTKGDANECSDAAPVPFDHILGKVILYIPYFGRLLMFLSDPMGQTASISFLILSCGILWMTAPEKIILNC